jgi:hypothetical protein
VWSRAFILGGACVALALGGCSIGSSSASNGGFTGEQGLVAATLNTLANDSSSANGTDICNNVFAAPVRARLDKLGKCSTIVANQLKTVDDFKLTIKAITVKGKTATARVQTVHNGTKVVQTVSLTREPAGWRVVSAV